MKYFYTDPLAAAWMAKHFGMKFKNEIETDDPPLDWEAIQDISAFHCWSGRLYIHPDSLSILEPRVGDLIGEQDYAIYVRDPKNHRHYSTWNDEKIIQRDGIAFHWPEVEE